MNPGKPDLLQRKHGYFNFLHPTKSSEIRIPDQHDPVNPVKILPPLLFIRFDIMGTD